MAPGVAKALTSIGRVLSGHKIVVLCVLVALVIFVHVYNFGYVSGDLRTFGQKWYLDLAKNGFGELRKNFANYNMPYLYLLLLASYTHMGALAAVKVIATIFDLLMGFGVAKIVYHYRQDKLVAAIAGVGVLVLPEVLMNSAWWGQADSTFSALVVWGMYFLLTKRVGWAWAFFGAAFAFKLQTFFVLPVLGITFIAYKHKFWVVLVGAAVFFAFDIPALLAGRSFSSLVAIYSSQAGQYQLLQFNIANIYQWFPPNAFPEGSYAAYSGIGFAIAGTAFVALTVGLFLRMRKAKTAPFWLLQVGAAYAMLIPFVLPDMHDRYFYVGDVLLFVCALFDRRYIALVVVSQIVAIYDYGTFLKFQFPPVLDISMQVLAGYEMVVVVVAIFLALFPYKGLFTRLVTKLEEQSRKDKLGLTLDEAQKSGS